MQTIIEEQENTQKNSMNQKPTFIGKTPFTQLSEGGEGTYLRMEDETWSKIEGVHDMQPFFMTLVSSTNQWMFIGSNGGLSAGRKNPESALFPYYTVDVILDNAEKTGSKTIFRVKQNDKTYLWEPFSERYAGVYKIHRNLYKNKFGSKLRFEEINHDLGLIFRYQWTFSDAFGFVKTAEVENFSFQTVHLEVLDGIQNILPSGVGSMLQNLRSNLVDAYKKNELHEESGLGVFSLSSMIVDRAEPSESLRATIVWSRGLDASKYLLSSQQLNRFRSGDFIHNESFTKAVKSSFFVHSHIEHLAAKEKKKWWIVADVEQSAASVHNLIHRLKFDENLLSDLDDDVHQANYQLEKLVGLADGLQKGVDKLSTTRHYSNVLYNIMRGGVFENQYRIDKSDLMRFVKINNVPLSKSTDSFWSNLPEHIDYFNLLSTLDSLENKDLKRICSMYLPLSFSRRHGDPSRPWNYFNIELKDEQGNNTYSFEGNWRDIFQNWEALAYSYPSFTYGMIAKFLNASTIDGYNPYRITSEGIDWEVIESENPWSYIGYWGDHQIIYLQKLLELKEQHFPGSMAKMLQEDHYVYANVPYRFRDYESIKNNPYDTIIFDEELHEHIDKFSKEVGADAKLVWKNNKPLRATFAEKILVMALTKLYNFVPDGGIWLNGQRPEWNDANNALVGNGMSMVTLHYLRRFMVFIKNAFGALEVQQIQLNHAVADLVEQLHDIFQDAPSEFNPHSRLDFVNALGRAGETYRTEAYAYFPDAPRMIEVRSIYELLNNAIDLAEKSIENNKRDDGLHHAYNLLRFQKDGLYVGELYEMLEGQVAALSSGLLEPKEVVEVLDALRDSKMFREDQQSYMLYPDRKLPTFVEKNSIPDESVKKSNIFQQLIAANDRRIIEVDIKGKHHFSGNIHNAKHLDEILQSLKAEGVVKGVQEDFDYVFQVYEEVFNHLSFTGRSGTFYGFEGLGSIYWHMVSKLLLAIQENIFAFANKPDAEKQVYDMMQHYYHIRAGIGLEKSPKAYGAFPTDAYSHTPSHAGVQQPGLTGQVKEDIINRWAVLGVQVKGGCIHINPILFRQEEMLTEQEIFRYIDVKGNLHRETFEPNTFAFTYCGTLFIYTSTDNTSLKVLLHDNQVVECDDMKIDSYLSAEIFKRTGYVSQVHLNYPFLQV